MRNASAVAQHDDYGHHDHHDTGPPTTMEEMPVPFQSYQVVHGELQGKFNMMLFGSIGLLLASLALVCHATFFQSLKTNSHKLLFS